MLCPGGGKVMARLAAWAVPVALLLSAGHAQGADTLASILEQPAGWCHDGISVPDLLDDGGMPSVEVIVVQAPLFSTNPKIGQKLRWVGLFHTALVFVQSVNGNAKNWTLEFAAVTNVLGSTLPQLDEENRTLHWDNAARYCATEGILWGREHWTQMFEPVMRLTAAQVSQLFQGFVLPLNNTQRSAKPRYQLWEVVSRDPTAHQPLVQDITCGDGTSWVLHHATTVLGAQLRSDFQLHYTSIVVPAEAVEPANVSDPEEWQKVFDYFREMVQVVRGKEAALARLFDVLWMLPVKYIYDSNAASYFRVIGNSFPWLEVRNRPLPLHGPPWLEPVAPRAAPVELPLASVVV